MSSRCIARRAVRRPGGDSRIGPNGPVQSAFPTDTDRSRQENTDIRRQNPGLQMASSSFLSPFIAHIARIDQIINRHFRLITELPIPRESVRLLPLLDVTYSMVIFTGNSSAPAAAGAGATRGSSGRGRGGRGRGRGGKRSERPAATEADLDAEMEDYQKNLATA